MNRLKSKLTSQNGASITYALLLFLVCAVVGSIVLAAGTAASGRMSKAVENDQRYYSVMSAAELLINKLDGETVEVINQGTRDAGSTEAFTTTSGYPKIGVKNSTGTPTSTVTYMDASNLGKVNDILVYTTAYLAGMKETLATSTDGCWALDVTGENEKALSVVIKPTVQYASSDSKLNLLGDETVADPALVLDIYNKWTDAEKKVVSTETDRYTIRLTFRADVETLEGTKEKTNTGGTKTEVLDVEKIVNWSFYSIETISA